MGRDVNHAIRPGPEQRRFGGLIAQPHIDLPAGEAWAQRSASIV
jgi:hypothetical protein